MANPSSSFRYPFRIGEIVNPFWHQILAAIDTVHDDPETDSPKAALFAEIDPALTNLLAYLEDRDRAIEDQVHEPFASRAKWMVD